MSCVDEKQICIKGKITGYIRNTRGVSWNNTVKQELEDAEGKIK